MPEEKKEPVLRYLSAQERLQSRELWEEAFPEDSREFADYYFAEKTKDNRILVLEEEGRIDSMIQLNPYLLQVKDEQWMSDYLVGVATRKNRRHRGYMRRLLARMMTDMRAEKMPFCFLMPADEAIYRPFGFTFIFDQPRLGWRDGPGEFERIPVQLRGEKVQWGGADAQAEEVSLFEAAAAFMNRWLADRYQVYAVRDAAYVERLVKEIASENGTLDMVMDDGRMIGLESFWGLTKKAQRLLYAGDSYVREVKKPKPAIMARIIDVERFVTVISLKPQAEEAEKALVLELEDPLIPDNDGTWKWVLDHYGSKLKRMRDVAEGQKLSAAELVSQKPAEGRPEESGTEEAFPALSLTITELTAWLFGYDIPAAAAAFADVIQPLQGVFLDEVV